MFGVDSGTRSYGRRSIVGDAGKTMMSVQQQTHQHSLTIARTLPASQARETISSRTFEHRLEKRRQDQASNEELQRYHTVNQRLSNNVASDQRVESLRRQKRYQQQSQELNEAYTWENEQREKETRALLAKQDQELAAAMSAMQSAKIAEEQNIRRICDESEEIQELKARLKAAELNRTRATQLQERALLTTQQHTREAELDAAMEAERRAAVELELQEAERRALVNMQARHVLQGQMEERELKKQLAYEEFLKEKAMVDDVVRAIEADDIAKMKKHLAKQQELQENIRTYLEERAVWREQEKKRAQDELERIKQYQSQMDERMAQLSREKQRRVDMKDAVLAKLTADIEAKRKEREEMEQLLYELYQEEAESRALAAIRENEERQARMRQEMVEANEEQKAYKAQRQAEQEKEEDEFRARMMDKFASDARLEAMNQQRRRREMLEYKNEVESMIAERKRIFEQQVESELQQREAQRMEEQKKLEIIERERQRLLHEYAASLKDFLPKGVFRNQQDFQQIMGRPPSVTDQRHAKAGLYFK